MSLGVGIEANLNSAPHMSAEMGSVPVVNPMLAAQTVFNPNVKDSRWLTLEVCREFTRNKCTRPDTECKFAHPPPHVEVQNGRVTCCFDSIKGKCQRRDPPCKYLHPPQHLRDLLVQNGKNNLIVRQLHVQAMLNPLLMQGAYPGVGKCQRKDPPCKYLHPPQHLREQLVQNGRNNLILKQFQAQALLNPILMQGAYPNMAHPNILQYPGGYGSPFISTVPGMMSPLDATPMPQVSAPLTMPNVPTANGTGPQKVQRPDRLENGSAGVSESAYSSVVSSMTDALANSASSQYAALYSLQATTPMVEVLQSGLGKKRPRDPNEDLILQGMNPNLPGMVPMIKRTAVPDKSGMPMYQHQSAPAYSPLVSFPGQQQFVPVTQTLSYYRGEQTSPYSPGVAGHPTTLGPRY